MADVVDLAMGPDGDLLETEGDLGFVSELEAIAQAARIYLATWRGEWSPDTREGVPYVEKVLARGVPLSDLRAVFRAALLRVPGIRSVPSLEVSRDNELRTLTVSFEADTDAGRLVSTDFAPFVVQVTP